jgi:hypothetical protein
MPPSSLASGYAMLGGEPQNQHLELPIPSKLQVFTTQVIPQTWALLGLLSDYGIVIPTKYQIYDSKGNALNYLGMIPQEKISNDFVNGQQNELWYERN